MGIIAVKCFAATKVPPHRRLAYWDEVAANTYTHVVTQSWDPLSFAPELRRAHLGPLRIAEVVSSAGSLLHTEEHVQRTTERVLFLQLQAAGESLHEQAGREAQLRPGDFTLLDNTLPYHTHFRARNTMLVIGISEPLVRRYLGCPEQWLCVRMPCRAGANRLVSSFIRGCWHQCRVGLQTTAAQHVAMALLHLVGGAYAAVAHAAAPPRELRVTARLRAISFIEAHLGDPALTPSGVAAACGMTPRHLHRLFAATDHTVGGYIASRRLQECARLLASPLFQGRSVGSIAVDHGFSSLNSFGKAFGARYGMTPSAYRRRSLSTTTG